jgi:alpha-beta hydrolase superfamily lysophospholipase
MLSGPAIAPSEAPSKLLRFIGRVLSAIAPKLGLLQLDGNAVSRDRAVVDAYMNDPLVYRGKVCARLAAEMLRAMDRVLDQAQHITVPMLILHGEEDTLTSPAGSQKLYETIRSPHKSIKHYPKLYHEIFNEPEQQQVLSDAVTWLDGQLI